MAYQFATFYVDDGLESGSPGDDSVRATLAAVVFSNPSGTTVLGTKAAHGLVTGAVITVSGCTQAYANDAWKVTYVNANTFTLDLADWTLFSGADVTGDAVPFGGSSWADAWATITLGATAARLGDGDFVKVAKSPAPVSIGTARWTGKAIPGSLDEVAYAEIGGSTNATPIVVTQVAHGHNDDDYVYIVDHKELVTFADSGSADLGTMTIDNPVGGQTEASFVMWYKQDIAAAGGTPFVGAIDMSIAAGGAGFVTTFEGDADAGGFTLGDWHFFAVTVDGTNHKLYIDGTLISTVANVDNFTGDLFLFNAADAGPTYPTHEAGNIAWFHYLLTLDEIAQLYAEGLAFDYRTDAAPDWTGFGYEPVGFYPVYWRDDGHCLRPTNGGGQTMYLTLGLNVVRNDTGNGAANGLWKVDNVTADTYELVGSVGVGVGGANGWAKNVTSAVVELSTAQTKTLENCDSHWKVAEGYPLFEMVPTAGGSGYTINDVLTVTTGGGDATVEVTQVAAITNEVLSVQLISRGSLGGYSTGAGQATSGGTGDGLCTVEVYATGQACGLVSSVFTSPETTTEQAVSGIQGTRNILASVGYAIPEGTRVAWQEIAPGSLAAYQAISIAKIQYGTIPSTDIFRICLCSDTDGLVVVDEFRLTGERKIFREGGGNLGAAILSIALYQGAINTGSLELDNIIAVTADGLCHDSLISKSGAEYDESEACHTISSIDGKVVVLDQGGYISSAWQPEPYRGTTETVTTYLRAGIRLAATATANESGKYGELVTYSGGWNPSSGLQDGTTIYEGVYGEVQIGINVSGVNFVALDRFVCVRFPAGIRIAGSSYDAIGAIGAFACGIGLSLGENTARITFESVHVCDTQISMSYAVRHTFDYIRSSRCTGTAIYLSNCADVIIKEWHSQDILGLGTLFSNNIEVRSWTALVGIALIPVGGSVFLRDADLTACIYEAMCDYVQDEIWNIGSVVQSHNHNNTGYSRIMRSGSQTDSLPTTRDGGTGVMWKIYHVPEVRGIDNFIYDPVVQSLALIPVVANKLVTVKVWLQKGNATSTDASLVCRGGQIAGVPDDVESTKASDTDWEEVVITFTPAENGVVEIEVRSWRRLNSERPGKYMEEEELPDPIERYTLIEDMTITQAT